MRHLRGIGWRGDRGRGRRRLGWQFGLGDCGAGLGITMNTKNSSTLHRWVELTKCPTEEVCHHRGPPTMSTTPEARTHSRAARVATPKT